MYNTTFNNEGGAALYALADSILHYYPEIKMIGYSSLASKLQIKRNNITLADKVHKQESQCNLVSLARRSSSDRRVGWVQIIATVYIAAYATEVYNN